MELCNETLEDFIQKTNNQNFKFKEIHYVKHNIKLEYEYQNA